MRAEVEESPRRWADTRPSLTPNPSPAGRGALHPAKVNWPPARGGSPRRAAGAAGGRPGLRKVLGYAAGALALLLCAPAAFAQTLAASDVEDDTATLTLTGHTGDWYYKYTVPSGDSSCTLVSSGTYTKSLTGLSKGTSYTYKAYSNSACTTELTSATTDAEFLTKPGQVTGVSAGSGNTTLAVSWTALTGTVTGYKVQWKKGDESYTSGRTNTVTGGSSTTNSITGLTNNTRYTVRVTAYNATGDGAASSEVTATPTTGFGFNDTVDDQTWSEGTAVNVTLPAANGYSGCYPASDTYSLSPALPAGLSFNSARDSRVISGTPTGPMVQTQYTYSTRNEACYQTASQTFNITVKGAIELSTASVALTEGGGNQSYNVKLAAQPNANATISITTGDAGAVTVSPSSLTFTTTNWGTNQAVTLTPVNDADGGDESVTITHTAAGGGIGGKTASLTANVTDDDKGITLSKTSYTIREGAQWHNTHTVVLATAPAGNVTVQEWVTPTNLHQFLERRPRSLTFTTSNWNLPQQIEMKVASSATRTRNVAGSMVHRSSGGGYDGASATLTVVYIDNQTPGLTISPGTLSVAEGSTGTFTVKLGGVPNGNVTVAVTSGDSGAATVSPTSLTFTTTTANWNTNRTVTVTAVQDADGNNETVTLTSAATGGGFDSVSGTVTLTVTDDEKALLASNVTHNSATLTITNHTGDWYYKKTVPSGDTTCTLVSSGTYTASLSGLTPATSYTFKAYSNSTCGTELTNASTDAEFLTRPAKVTGVTAAGGTDAGALDVSWTAVTGAASYKVQWKTSAQQWAGSRQTTSTTTSKTITGLTGGTQYSVRVAAGNASGDGAWSDTATGTAATEGATPSTTSLSVPEGGSASYTVVLDTTPSHAVTIAVAKQSGGDSDLTVSPASLSFGATNWNSPQAVTVTAGQDKDTADGTATLTHTATSSDSGYNGVTIANVTATEGDDDAPGALVSKTAVPVPEGGSATWTVRLASLPSATVFIDLAKQSGGDADLTVSPAQLTFTTKGWDLPQTVTVSAAEDTDAARGTATFTHTATSTDASYGASLAIASVAATEDDDELGVTVSKKAVSVPEGGSATWTVVLDGPPAQNVTIAVAKKTGGDGNLTASPSSLTFTSTNWSSAQTVTASAAQDSDEADGAATFTHTATSTDTDFNGLAIASVAATEDDDDAPGVTVSKASVSVTEGSNATYTVVLDTAPAHNVTIAVAKQTGGDADLTVSPASLTFTSTNWSSAQTVTVAAAEDDTDDTDGAATFTHTATSTDADYGGIAIASVTATEADNDTLAGVTVSKASVSVPEGSTATYTVALDTAPTQNVTIAVAKQSGGDADLTVSPASLTFTSTNWSSAQTVTVSAARDADAAHGAATITHTATSTDASYGGITIASVAATEADTAPASADVTLAVSRDNRTAIPLRDLPFTGAAGVTPRGVKIVTLPGASRGTLGLVKTGIYAGAATVLCVGTITPITAGQEVLDALSTVLYFCPKDGFNAATFEFQVIDSRGQTSEPRTATLVGPPGQVTGLVAEAGSAYVRLRWTDPENPSITGYEYRRKSGAGATWGAWTAMTGSGAATTSYAVSGLTNATAYTFQVRARSAGGAGAIPSAEVTATPSSAVVPAAPAGLQAVNIGFNAGGSNVNVRLVWDDPKDPSITRYEAEREFSGSKGNWLNSIGQSNNHVSGSGATTTSAEIVAGSHENVYAFRVRAVNAAGNGPWSVTGSVELVGDGETPVLASVEPGNGKLRLRWTHSGSSLKTPVGGGYWGYRDGRPPADGNVGTGTDTDLSKTHAGAAARSYVVGSLTNGNTYTWAVYSWGKIVADNTNDRVPLYSNTRTLTLPAAPAAPAGLTAKATSGGAALSWTDPKSAVITGWQYQSKAGVGSYGSWTRVPGSDGGTTSFSVSGLTDGTEHKFKVRAVIEYETALGGTLAGAASGEVSVTPVGVVVSKDRLALTEGGAAGAYTVKLSHAPTANVTITVSVDGDGSVTADTDDAATGNQTTLTFTTTNYATVQTVKVKAAEDDDGRDSTATIAHSASSADARYGNLTGLPGLTAAVTDNDALGITLSASSVSVTEGSTATYTVRLDVKPTSGVTVTIARASGGDSDLTIADTDPGTTGTQNTLKFSTTNYATARTVTVTAAEDDNDVIDGTATFTHTAAGGGYGNVAAVTLAATETDDDTGIVLTPASVSVPEEGSATYTVALGTQPAAGVTVAIARASGGDTDLSVSPSSLTFSTTNYATAQTVTVSAADDVDEVNGTATFTHTAAGAGSGYAGASASLAATEADNERRIDLSVSTVALTEGGSTGTYTVALSSAPDANVTVAVSSDDSGAVTASPSSLTFSTTNYSTARTVTLTAVNDGDGADESVTVSNSASGGGYDASGDVTVSVDDDDQGLTLSASTVALTEGGSTGSYTVRLAAAPNADVTVAVSSDDTGAVTVSPSSLTFTTTNYASTQTVTLTVVGDADGADESVTVSNTSSGGGYDASGNVTATVDDDDQGLTLSASTVSLTEGGSTGSYTVRLAAAPNADVTVAVSSGDTGAVTASPSSLTFTTTNYSTAQTVTLTAVGDADGADESVTVSNTASGGGYDASGDVTATVDDDEQGLTLSASTVALIEGGSTGSYTVALSSAPDADVTVAVSSGDTGAVTASPSSLTFTTTNYSTAQTVTLTAVGDADGADESVTVSNTASGGGYDSSGDVTVSVDDDEQGLTLSASTVALTEGGSTGSYTVKLNAAPNADVTVAVSSGDTGAVTVSPSSLTFTTTNYASVQTVTLTTVGDADGADESVTVSNTASGGGYDSSGDVAVSVDDDDQGLTLSVSTVSLTEGGSTGSYTVKLNAAPNADVTVAVSSGDTGAVTASPTSLTFTTTNYSTVQTVTLTAVEDGDGTDESVTVSNTASGGGYDASGDVTATVDDDDQGLDLSASTVSLTEGGSTGSYTVALSAAPDANVTVAVSSGDTGAVTASPSSLTFTTTNYSTAQTVTLTAVGDADGADESVTVSNTASGGGYDSSGDVTVSVDDDEQGLTLSASTVALTEGGSTGSYTVKLNAAPNADVTVAVSSGDTGAVTVSPSSLTFTTTNYASVQTVTLTTVGDADGADESVTVSNTASGGGYDSSGDVAVSVDDDDQGLTLSVSTVSLTEGGSTGSYTVKLNAAPNADVTVAVSSGDTGAVTASPTSLTFTTTNYSTAQTVTLTAVEDGDGTDESVTVSNTASGGGYDSSGDVTATVDDDDQGLTLSASTVSLTEGGSTGSYTVKLDAAPNADVTVTVSSGDTGAVTASPSSLTFSTTNYATARTVTLTAVGDADGADESVTVSNTASGGGYTASGDVTATVDDDDQGLTLSASTVSLTEGGSTGSYTVKLDAAPNADVTVAVSSGDTGAVTASPTSLTFTTTNYSTVQTVTLTAVGDADGADESVTVSNTASGGGYDASGDVTVSVDDDDQGLTFSASTVSLTEGGSTGSYTVRLAQAPNADVTVTVSSADTGAVTASPTSLTFTTTNYSTVQTVTLTAVGDADGADESVTVSNTASGGGYDTSGAVTVSVDDDDQGLTLSVSSVRVPEGGRQTYTVKLAARPAGTVTVAIAKAAGGDADLTVSRSTLTFTTGNWSGTQTVTVRAAEETGDDSANGTATFTHTASGGGYDASATLTATELDNDRVVGIPATLRVPEGGTATYTVKLAAQPSANVTLTLARSGDSDLTVDTEGGTPGDQNTLTFSNSNYATARTVTVAAAQDGDYANGTAVISHTAASSDAGYAGIPIPSVTATEADDDSPPRSPVGGLALSSSNVTVPEGGTVTYTVALASRPSGDVTVTLTRDPGGDADLTVDTDPDTPGAQVTLTFTPARWNIPQTVTVAAAPDADGIDGTATFTHAASGGGYGGVSATLAAAEADDDRRLVLSPSSLTVPEGSTATYTVALASQPAGDVTVTLTRDPGGDADLAVDTDPDAPGAQATLTFTPADWRTARTVTVAAAADADGLDGTATFTHTASGGGYGGASVTLAATEADDDRRLVLSPSRLTVPEGMAATYTVALASQPAGDVTVTLARDPGGDADLAVDTDPDAPGAQSTLVFTPADWRTARTVTVAAAADADGVDGTATFTHTAAGGIWTGVTATLAVVEEEEQAPVAVGALPALTLVPGGAPRTVDVSGAFRGSNLSYAVRSSDEALVAASVQAARVTLTPLRQGEAQITVTARNRTGEARQSFTATVVADPADKTAVKDGLAAIGRGMLSSIDMALGARLRGESSEGVRLAGYAVASGGIEAAPDTAQGFSPGTAQGFSPDVAQGFPPGAGRAFPDREREDEIADLDWLDGTSFVVALNAEADAGEGAGGLPRWTFWGQGDLQSFASDRSSVDGETRTAWLGLDTAWGDDWLLGAAVSVSRGSADYAFEGGGGSGRLQTSLTSVHPYLRWRPWEDGSVWAALGAGNGRVENRRDRLGRVERGDLSMLTAWGGGRYALPFVLGGAELALLGDLAFLRARTDAAQGSLDDVSSLVSRLRVGFEGSYEIRMDPGTLSPFGQVSARYDGGDGETGGGMEVSGGVRYHRGRMSFETGGRVLWAGAGDYEESGWNLALALGPREDGRGLSMSLSPTWGVAQHRALEALWRPDALSVLDDGTAPAGDGHGLRTSIGYGLRWPAPAALLTPYAEHERFSSGDRHTSMGVRLEHRPSRLEVDLRGELEEGTGRDTGDAGVYVDVGVRF